jgi:hypothetical protein
VSLFESSMVIRPYSECTRCKMQNQAIL